MTEVEILKKRIAELEEVIQDHIDSFDKEVKETREAMLAKAREYESQKKELESLHSLPEKDGEWRFTLDIVDRTGNGRRSAFRVSPYVIDDAMNGDMSQDSVIRSLFDQISSKGVEMVMGLAEDLRRGRR